MFGILAINISPLRGYFSKILRVYKNLGMHPSKMDSVEKTKQSFWNRRIPKLELGNEKTRDGLRQGGLYSHVGSWVRAV